VNDLAYSVGLALRAELGVAAGYPYESLGARAFLAERRQELKFAEEKIAKGRSDSKRLAQG